MPEVAESEEQSSPTSPQPVKQIPSPANGQETGQDNEQTPDQGNGQTEEEQNDSPSLRSELSALDERIQELESYTRGLRETEASFLESPSTESLRTVTGRLHLDYWAYPGDSRGVNLIETGQAQVSPQDRLELRRVRVGIRGQVPPQNVSYQLDLEFAGVEQIGIRDAWIGIDNVPFVNAFRVGNQKRPYILDQLNSSNFIVFIERPLIAEALNDSNRRLGMQMFGATDRRDVNWRFGLFHLERIEQRGFIANDNYQMELAGRLATTAWCCESSNGWNYLHLGVSSSIGFPDDTSGETTARYRTRPEARSISRWLDTAEITGAEASQLLGTEWVWNAGSFQVGGEYINFWLQRGDTFGNDVHLHGGYVYVSYFLTGETTPWNRQLGILGRVKPKDNFLYKGRWCGLGALQIAARGSYADLNDEGVLGGAGRAATLALNWYWNSHTRLQLNYIIGHISDRKRVVSGDVVSGHYQIAGVRLSIDY